ncbi:MAG: hypothetical protein IPM18_09020 [Phycisphaerales bacterium]|nr:hypothetical protein [Phycisphaerales bacterium]
MKSTNATESPRNNKLMQRFSNQNTIRMTRMVEFRLWEAAVVPASDVGFG